MSKTSTAPIKLSDTQSYFLGAAVQTALTGTDYYGKVEEKPELVIYRKGQQRRGHEGVPVSQIKQLIRAGVIEASTVGKHKLTKLGIQMAEEEIKERTGKDIWEWRQEIIDAKAAEDAETQAEIEAASLPFKGIKIKHEDKKVDLAKFIADENGRRSSGVQLSLSQLTEIGEQIAAKK